jgi:uncharacterized protein
MESVGMTTDARTATEHSVPVRPRERIKAIDVLRGLALFGVLMVNLLTEFRVSVFQQFLPNNGTLSSLDRLTDTFVSTVLELKAISLFPCCLAWGWRSNLNALATTHHASFCSSDD